MTTSTQWYLDSIEQELADLPPDERAELLEDLAAHFSEFDSDEDLVTTLGDPAAYARELRDAAGLSATPPFDTHVALVDRARANFDALRRSAQWRAVAGFLPELRPAWWVLRAWLIVVAIAEAPTDAGGLDFPFPRVAGNALVGVAALMLVVPVSVMLGLQARRGQRKGLNVALTVFGALFFVVVPASANDDADPAPWFNHASTTMVRGVTTVGSGQLAANDIWAYDSDGNRYLVNRVIPTSGGQVVSRAIIEYQALCPNDLVKGPARALHTAEGAPIVCVGERGTTASTAPTTAAQAATTAPTTIVSSTTVPTTTVSSTTVPTTITEATR